MRAIKEEMAVEPCGISVPADRYQFLTELGIKRLNDDERVAFRLRFLEALTIAQVADHMNRSWYEADFLIDRAVRKVRSVFREQLQATI